jgi:rod shape-determining protein MreB
MVIAVPSEVTGVERRAVQDAAEFAGARRPVYLIEEPMAAAIGCGLPVGEPSANLIVDIGGGTTEVAVISMGGIVTANSARTAGDQMNEALVAGFRKAYALDVGENTAEEVKIQIGSAWPLAEEFSAEVGGRDAVTGLPRTQVVTTEEVRSMLDEPVALIVDSIRTTLERTPAELAADIINNGLVLSGGGALLVGLAERITNDTGIEAFIAEEPLYSVVLGCGMTLDNLEALKNMSNRDMVE